MIAWGFYMRYQTGLPIDGEVAQVKHNNLAGSAPLERGINSLLGPVRVLDTILYS